eukprot:1107480-Prorocentrum_minimum.AAC.1
MAKAGELTSTRLFGVVSGSIKGPTRVASTSISFATFDQVSGRHSILQKQRSAVPVIIRVDSRIVPKPEAKYVTKRIGCFVAVLSADPDRSITLMSD